MAKEVAGRTQLNISPSPETIEKLDKLVQQFGLRHKNVKNRNVAAADILDKYIDLYIWLVQQQDHQLQKQIDSLKPKTRS